MCRSSRNVLTWLVTKPSSLWKTQKYRWRFVSLQSSSVLRVNRITMHANIFPLLLEEQLQQLSWHAKAAQWLQGNWFLGVRGPQWRTYLCLWRTGILAALPQHAEAKSGIGLTTSGRKWGTNLFLCTPIWSSCYYLGLGTKRVKQNAECQRSCFLLSAVT